MPARHVGGAHADALLDQLRHIGAGAPLALLVQPSLPRDRATLEDALLDPVADAPLPARHGQVDAVGQPVGQRGRPGTLGGLVHRLEEALRAARPREGVALRLGERRRRRLERGAQRLAELLRRLVGQHVAEAVEEDIARVALDDCKLAHRKGLRRGCREHLGLRRVDKDLVAIQRGVGVILAAAEDQVEPVRLGLGLHLRLVLAVTVDVDARALPPRRRLLVGQMVNQVAVPLGPQHLTDEVGALVEAALAAARRPPPPLGDELGSDAVDVADGGARQLLQAVAQLDDPIAVRAADQIVDGAHDEDVLGLVELGVGDVVGVHHPDHELRRRRKDARSAHQGRQGRQGE